MGYGIEKEFFYCHFLRLISFDYFRDVLVYYFQPCAEIEIVRRSYRAESHHGKSVPSAVIENAVADNGIPGVYSENTHTKPPLAAIFNKKDPQCNYSIL